jgi:hypothetical protein
MYEYLEEELAMCGKSCKCYFLSVCGLLQHNQNLSSHCGSPFVSSLGGTLGSATSRPGMMFLSSVLDATGLLAL